MPESESGRLSMDDYSPQPARVRLRPGVPDRNDRLCCPVCRVDQTVESAVVAFRHAESALSDHRDRVKDTRIPETSTEWRRRFGPRVDLFERRSNADRRLPTPVVDMYYETCGNCGLLYDPYARQRAEEIRRVTNEIVGLLPAVEAISILRSEV